MNRDNNVVECLIVRFESWCSPTFFFRVWKLDEAVHEARWLVHVGQHEERSNLDACIPVTGSLLARLAGNVNIQLLLCNEISQKKFANYNQLANMVGLCVKRSPLTKVTLVRYPVRAICDLSCALALCCATMVFQTIRVSSLCKNQTLFDLWLCSVVIMGWCGWLPKAPLHACFANTL